MLAQACTAAAGAATAQEDYRCLNGPADGQVLSGCRLRHVKMATMPRQQSGALEEPPAPHLTRRGSQQFLVRCLPKWQLPHLSRIFSMTTVLSVLLPESQEYLGVSANTAGLCHFIAANSAVCTTCCLSTGTLPAGKPAPILQLSS